MREYSAGVDSYLENGKGIVARHLVWIEAKNRSTGATESTGFWNGIDTQLFTIAGASRTYYGAGALLGVSPIQAGVGAFVRMQRLTLSGMPTEVLQMIHEYDSRLAPVEVHRALYNTDTGALVDEPHRVLKGTVESLEVPTPADGESGDVTLTVASAARSLTRPLTLKKSDAAQRAIHATDRGREYASISGAVSVFWGKKRAGGSPPSTASTMTNDWDAIWRDND